MDRREALRLMAAGLAVACARPEESNSRPQVPAPTEKPPIIEIQTKQAVLDAWINLLYSSQRYDSTQLKMEVVNLNTWRNYFQEIVKSNTHPTNVPLKAKWLASSTLEGNNGFKGSKYTGELEINNINLRLSSSPLSHADKANGISWSGSGAIGFIRRSRAIYAFTYDWVRNRETFTRWLSAAESNLPDFSPWESEQWGTRLQLVNGVWQRNRVLNNTIGGSPMLKNFEVPSTVMFGDRTLGECGQSGPCRRISVDVK